MALTTDQMKSWVEELIGKNRVLEEENKSLNSKGISVETDGSQGQGQVHGQDESCQSKICVLEQEVKDVKSRMSAIEQENQTLKSKLLELMEKLQILEQKLSSGVEGRSQEENEPPRKQRKIESDDTALGSSDKILTVVTTTPLEIEEILGLIFSNLGKHDLLNSRMVSHAWNEESLKILRKSEFTQVLRENRIKEFLLFATPTGQAPRPFIVPFHLNFNISLNSYGAMSYHLEDLISHVDSLCKIFGSQSISKLTLTTLDFIDTEDEIKEMGLIEFLTLISPGLETLDLTTLCFKINFLKNQIITFPNLKKLICNACPCQYEKAIGGSDLTYISIIENSPNFEDLTLNYPRDLKSWPLKFNQVKTLSLEKMLKPQNILDKILASSGPPVLRELNFRDDVSGTAEDKIVVSNILESVSSTLKSLKIRQLLPHLAENEGISPIMRFPRLPYLEHLDLGLEYKIDNKCWVNSEDINLSQETFPSLKSIELPIGFTFKSPSVQTEEVEVRLEFPNLIKLKIRVNSAGPEQLNESLEHFQKIFPNPSILSLVNAGGHGGVKYLLERILKSNWSKNIQKFEMIGFNGDYLGEILDQLEFNPQVVLKNCDGILEESVRKEFQISMRKMRMEYEEIVDDSGFIILSRANQADSVKMTNLNTIKLEFTDAHYNKSYSSSTESIANCIGYVKYFPQLRMMEVSEGLFHQVISMREGRILEFKSKLPSVVLYVT